MNKLHRGRVAFVLAVSVACACGDSTEPEVQRAAETRIEAGDGQVRIPGAPVLIRPRVQAMDESGDPLRQEDLEVVWQTVAGGGTLEDPEIFTDATGQAATVWRLGPDLGDQTLTGSINGTTPVTFTARAVEVGPIVFTSGRAARPDRRGLDWHVFAMQPDGSDVVQLTSGTVRDFGPTWSPDGTAIDFLRGIQSPGGSGGAPVLRVFLPSLEVGNFVNGEGGGLDWSPDGARGALSLWSGGPFCSSRTLFVVYADGSIPTPLWDRPACGHNAAPDWSPDGAKLAFEAWGVMGTDTISSRSGARIWTIGADGSEPGPVPGEPIGARPHWLPDNRHLVVAPGLRILDAETGEEEVVCTGASGLRPGGVSPDGRLVLGQLGSDVYVVDLETCELTNLTNRPDDFDGDPAWRPSAP